MDGRFGRIQLGGPEGGAGSFPGASSSSGGGQSPWVKYPVMAVAGVAAVILATPRVVGGLVRGARERFGRRGGGGYSRTGGVGGGLGGYGGGSRTAPYTSRGSFARGRGEYSGVGGGVGAGGAGDVEGDLLGDESDEDERV